MVEQDKSRYDRSRYVSSSSSSGNRSNSDSRFRGRYHDSFYDDMLIEDEEPATSFKSRLPEQKRGAFSRSSAADQDEATSDGLDEEPDDDLDVDDTGKIRRRSASEASNEGQVGGDEEGRDQLHSNSRGTTAHRRSYSRAAVERDIAEGNQGDSASSTLAAKKRKGNRGLRVALVVLAVLVLVGAGAAFAYVNNVAGNLRSGVNQELLDVLVDTDIAKEPFYMMLLGTDGSSERDEDEELGGVYRSDSMILARVDAPNHKITMVTIPRDIPVDLGQYGEQKINAAYAFGGPALTVKTVSELAGVPISHYAEIDFDGFEAMVNALGGVTVDVPMRIDDEDAGGVVEAGEQRLDGWHALILCRARHAYDDYGDGDAYRAANQRLVISAIAKEALSADIGTIARTVQTASEYVTTDLALNDIIGLAQVMRGIDPEKDIYTASAPTTSQYINGGWYEYLNKQEWAKMMERVDAGLPPLEETEIDENTGVVMATAGDGTGESSSGSTSTKNSRSTITVKNATDITGQASKVRDELKASGYSNVLIGETNSRFSYPNTLVVYDSPDRKAEAEAIVDVMGQGQAYYDEDTQYVMDDNDFIVIIGEDWKA